MKNVVNTVICYDNPEEVITYAEKFFSLDGSCEAALIVTINKISNFSEAALVNTLKSINEDIYVYNPNANLGYINGMIFGYRKYLDNHEEPKYIIMSNTDIIYPDASFLRTLLDKDYDEDVWCIGPSVFVPERGSFDNPVCETRRSKRDIQRIITILKTPLIGPLYIIASKIKGNYVRRAEEESHEVYEVHGCFFIITKDLGREFIRKPFGALLYSEEDYVAENVYKRRKKTLYDADLKVYHDEHSVTGKLDYRKIANYIIESERVILRDYYE